MRTNTSKKKIRTIIRKDISLCVFVGRSLLFNRVVTIPKGFFWTYWKSVPQKKTKPKPVRITWYRGGKSVEGRGTIFRFHKQGPDGQKYVQIVWDQTIHNELYRTFSYSYFVLYGMKSLKRPSKKSRSLLAHQEMFQVYEIAKNHFLFVPAVVYSKSEYAEIFRRLAEIDLFNRWGITEGEKPAHLVMHSSRWMPIKELGRHLHHQNVIYYLIDRQRRHLYIGKTEQLVVCELSQGDRKSLDGICSGMMFSRLRRNPISEDLYTAPREESG